MRYPVINLGPRMGGMLDDYKNEINNLKASLYRGQPFSGYTPPPNQYPPAGPAPAPAAPANPNYSGPRSFPPAQPPMVATGQPRVNPNDISVAPPPAPPVFTGLDPYAPRPGVVTGIPPGPDFQYPPTIPQLPPIPKPTTCPEGYTWTPSGCKQDVASVPNRPATGPISNLAPTTSPTASFAPSGQSGGINSGGNSWNSAPGAVDPYGSVPSVDCGPGKFWDGTKCRGSVGSIPTIPGGGSPGSTIPTGFDPGMPGTTSYSGMGTIRIVGDFGAPKMLGMVRIVR